MNWGLRILYQKFIVITLILIFSAFSKRKNHLKMGFYKKYLFRFDYFWAIRQQISLWIENSVSFHTLYDWNVKWVLFSFDVQFLFECCPFLRSCSFNPQNYVRTLTVKVVQTVFVTEIITHKYISLRQNSNSSSLSYGAITHLLLSTATAPELPTFILLRSVPKSSSHVFLGLPLSPVSTGFQCYIFFTSL